MHESYANRKIKLRQNFIGSRAEVATLIPLTKTTNRVKEEVHPLDAFFICATP